MGELATEIKSVEELKRIKQSQCNEVPIDNVLGSTCTRYSVVCKKMDNDELGTISKLPPPASNILRDLIQRVELLEAQNVVIEKQNEVIEWIKSGVIKLMKNEDGKI